MSTDVAIVATAVALGVIALIIAVNNFVGKREPPRNVAEERERWEDEQW